MASYKAVSTQAVLCHKFVTSRLACTRNFEIMKSLLVEKLGSFRLLPTLLLLLLLCLSLGDYLRDVFTYELDPFY
jgi:hypothetical protein